MVSDRNGTRGSGKGHKVVELTILGGSGGWPQAGQACSGYLVSGDGYRLLIDPGYGIAGEVQRYCRPDQIDAVLVSHGHPDHCADLNPLLRARVLGSRRCDPLPVLAPAGALTPVLELDPVSSIRAGAEEMLADPGSKIDFGPFTVLAAEVRHHVTSYGFRITGSDGAVLAYTADSGPSPDRVDLAQDANLLLGEVSYPERVPPADARYLCDARQLAELALAADVDQCVVTHLMPETDPFRALALMRDAGLEEVVLARPGSVLGIEPRPAAIGLPRRAAPKVVTLTKSAPRRAAGH